MSELKPCPFCGGVPEHEIFHDGFFMMCRVTCGKCGAEITRVFELGGEAICDWNRRADNDR